MAGTPKEFVLDLSRFVEKAKGNLDQVVRKIVLDIGTRIIMRSPVGDDTYWKNPAPKGYIGGRFRANWQYGEGAMPTGTLAAIDAGGSATIAREIGKIEPKDAWLKVHWWANNLPYAQRLESGWSHRQAPAGMVGVTVVEFQSIVGDAAAAVKK